MSRDAILVVDDEKNIRLALSQALKPLDRPVLSALSGEEALEMLADPGIGVMILDFRLPGIDGMAVLERASRERPDVAVIMITANEGGRHKAYAEMLGVVEYLRKPFPMESLLDAVQRALKPAPGGEPAPVSNDSPLGPLRRTRAKKKTEG